VSRPALSTTNAASAVATQRSTEKRMAEASLPVRAPVSARSPGRRAHLGLAAPTGRHAALGALMGVAGLLYSLGLSGSGWANAYYSAAAQAGALSWRAFFFGGLDPAGGITVDKPPAALWLTGLSVRIFGLSTPSLLLPQALCAVAATALLYGTVRRQALTLAAGRPGTTEAAVEAGAAAAGLLAGAVLALTPVVTLMARYDNPDGLMVLLSVAAAYLLVRSLEAPRGGGGWLMASGTFLGLSFLTKLLQSWLIVPAFALVALVAGAGSIRRRLVRVSAAGAAMIAAAGWWVLVVQLTPADQRPWIGGSRDNSVIELALGYNGLGRLTGQEGGGGAADVARPGSWGRLFGSWAPEAGWLLPAALICLAAGWLLTRGRDRRDPVRAGLLLWGGWLLVAGIVLSALRGISHSYYAIQLAPAIGGAVALGGGLLWQRAIEDDAIRTRRVLAATVALTAAWSAGLLLSRPAWPILAAPVALAAAAVAMAGLRVVGHPSPGAGPASQQVPESGKRRLVPASSRVSRRVLGAAVLVAMLVGPTAWSVATAQAVHRGANVYSGPGVTEVHTPAGISPDSTTGTRLPTALVDQVRAGAPGYDWAAAVIGRRAADLQLASGAPVWALGGFSGHDPHPTLDEFRAAVAAARVHYLVLTSRGSSHGAPAEQIAHWASGAYTWSRVGDWLLVDLTSGTGSQ
jgi:4-amino-4-deoxy-L-arabinose transferase-like glycosyltransferase